MFRRSYHPYSGYTPGLSQYSVKSLGEPVHSGTQGSLPLYTPLTPRTRTLVNAPPLKSDEPRVPGTRTSPYSLSKAYSGYLINPRLFHLSLISSLQPVVVHLSLVIQ